jgi:hypothetical protein
MEHLQGKTPSCNLSSIFSLVGWFYACFILQLISAKDMPLTGAKRIAW